MDISFASVDPAARKAATVRPEERGFAAAAHFPLGAIPLWGFVFLALMWVYFKERSREVVFHIQQAMLFQMAQLAAWFLWVVVGVVLKPVEAISPRIADLLSSANLVFLILFLVPYFLLCLAGAVSVYIGRPFMYPIIGPRVLAGSVSKFQTED